MTDKVPLILWSGGLDSTYLVWDNISKGRSVDVVYVELANNASKVKRELAARVKIKAKLDEYESKIRKDYIFKVMPLIEGDNLSKEICYPQPYMWSYALQSVFDSSRHSHVETGYIKIDDFVSIKDSCEKFIALGSEIFFEREHPIELKFPLISFDKSQLLDSYEGSDYGKSILQEVTWCEGGGRVDGKWTNKCDCRPCKTMREIRMFREASKVNG
jgi:7-cyano-7-deazaguanine synthase in queuosine biosynthesis